MTDKFRFSIRTKLLIALLISILFASLVFYLVYQFGGFLVWRYYLGESDKQERAEEYVEDFQNYVYRNQLTIDDTAMISKWSAGRYVDLIVYKDSNLIYAPEWFEDFTAEGSDTEAYESYPDEDLETEYSSDTASEAESEVITDISFYEKWFLGDRGFEQYLTEEALKDYRAALDDALGDSRTLYPVYFVGGTLIVAVVDFTEEALGNLVFAVSLLAAITVIAIIMICYFGRITKRIRLLQKNVRIIEEGDLDHKIDRSGHDEISLLANDVGCMRDSIVENMTREQRAWEANAGLITAMSHDIRTPLTVLLGYLDLIEMQNNGEISAEYISACRDNALRLKNLSDDMFSYFLVFGKSESEPSFVRVDAGELTAHIISEYTLLLFEKGYTLENSGDIRGLFIKIDDRYFRRIIENIFSNIIKYADTGYPVRLSASYDGKDLILSCQNRRRDDKDMPESNGIGLKTCMKMMEEMGGIMTIKEDDGMFTVDMSFPAEKENDSTYP